MISRGQGQQPLDADQKGERVGTARGPAAQNIEKGKLFHRPFCIS